MPEQTPTRSNADVIRRFAEIIDAGDAEALDEIVAPDAVVWYPQSGEVTHGLENLRRTLQFYPGGTPNTDLSRSRFIGDEHYVMTPTFNLVKVSGAGDAVSAWIRSTYPDGTDWYIIVFATVQNGKIVRTTMFFGPQFDAPEWRKDFVELTEEQPW